MPASGSLDEYRLAGVLLILAFVLFGIGASLPVVGERGNSGIYTLPLREHLLAVAENAVAWRWANVLMGAAVVILAAGLSELATVLEASGERALSRLGLIGFLFAAVLWVIFSAWRATVTVLAAEETVASGSVPAYYEPLARWGFALFYAYAVVAFLALAAYGGSLIGAGLLPPWVGWATLVYSVALLVLLLATGDTLPAFHYPPGLLIGILLLIGG
jgi:hypothetical protein